MVMDSLRNLLVMLSKLMYVTASDRFICVLNSKYSVTAGLAIITWLCFV